MIKGKRNYLLRGNVTLKRRRESKVGSRHCTEFNMAGKQVSHETVSSMAKDKGIGQSPNWVSSYYQDDKKSLKGNVELMRLVIGRPIKI